MPVVLSGVSTISEVGISDAAFTDHLQWYIREVKTDAIDKKILFNIKLIN
jgi:hypothetical protein